MSENDLEEPGRRRAGGKIREQEVLDDAVMKRSLQRRQGRLGGQDGSTADDRGRDMALDPRTEVGRRMLVAVLIRLAELMVQLKRRGQRREREQGQAQQRDNEECG